MRPHPDHIPAMSMTASAAPQSRRAATRFAPLMAEGVSRVYGRDTVLREASLTLRPGEVTALLGSSGAGKSTLLRLFAGLEPVDTGTIRHGEALWSRPGTTLPPEDRRIGLIFQDFALFPHLSLVENVRFGLTALDRAAGRAIALDWLARVGLGHRGEAYPHELSGGEQQRVAIARAMAPGPCALLMDEPFSGLDPVLREDVREMTLEAVHEAGIPALFVTHDPEEAMSHADQLGVMSHGRLVQTGRPSELYLRPASRVVAAALGPVSILPAGRVSGSAVETPVGRFPAPGLAEGSHAELVLREAALRPEPGSPIAAELQRVSFAGTHLHLHARIGEHPVLIYAAPAEGAGLTPGPTGIGVDPSLVFVFPVAGDGAQPA